jgi:polyhydroxybutyrate depolymerase
MQLGRITGVAWLVLAWGCEARPSRQSAATADAHAGPVAGFATEARRELAPASLEPAAGSGGAPADGGEQAAPPAAGSGGSAALGPAEGSPAPSPSAPLACITDGVLAPGDHERQLEYAGLARSYRLHVPPAYSGRAPLPLVLVMHGLSVDGLQMEIMSAFDAVADEHGFAVVYPTSDSGSWNAGGCCNPDGPDDVAFMSLVVARVQKEMCIDPQRIYASGMSNGALMAQLLGCKAADLFAAIAPVSGPLLLPDADCKPARPMPVMAVHGKNDTLLGYDDGGYLPLISAPGTVVPSAPDSTAAWARRDKCMSGPSAPTPKADWPTRPASGGVVPGAGGWIPDEWAAMSAPMTPGASCAWYSDCAQGAEVGLCTHDGGHDWPSGTSAAIWAFFERHPLP